MQLSNALPLADTPAVTHLSVKGCARRYGKSERWVREMVRLRQLPCLRIGGAVIFSEAQLTSWENRQNNCQ
jgi:hypothetical protein